MKVRWHGVAVLAVALAVAGVAADEVTLGDGSRLMGKVTGVLPGKVLLATEFAGTLALDSRRITGIRMDTQLNLSLADGQRLQGTMAAAGNGAVLRTDAGDLAIADLKPVRAVWAEGQPEPLPPARAWAHELAVDVGGRSGNSPKFRLGAAVNSVLSGPVDRLALYARSSQASEDGRESEDEVIGGADYERIFRERHSWYSRGELERDEIEGLDLRATAAGGYGYFFIRKETEALRGRVGLQYRREKYYTGQTEDTVAPEFNLRYELALRTWLKLVSEVTYAPAFDDPSDYRIDHTSAVDIPLAASKHLALRLGVTNTYDSFVVEGREHFDTIYMARLVLKLP